MKWALVVLLPFLPLISASHGITLPYEYLVRRSTQARHISLARDAKIRRAAPVLPSGWSYSACIREPTSGRTLTGYSFTSDSMTVTSCVAACNYRGYTHAGLEYARECYCGNVYEGGATGGGTVAPASDCAKPCSGDAGQVCGDGNRLSVYATAANTFLPTGWLYYNCVREPTSGRTLSGYSFASATMTVPACISACSSRGFKYAGAEWSQECFCGNTFDGGATGGGTVTPSTDCNMACSGDAAQTCGAGNRLSVYANQAVTQPWSFYGCIREPTTGRTLSGYSFVSASLTLESCIAACNSRGYIYAGAEYGKECYCGNTLDGGATGGGTSAPGSDCNMPCAGNGTETCGAGWRLSVWTSSGVAPGAPTLPPFWSATSKCITDSVNSRALSGNSFTSQSLTLDACITACDKEGFNYAGTEYASECFCGNTISNANGVGATVSDADCNMACNGNPLQKCGGPNRITLYTKTPPILPAGWSKNFCSVDSPTRVLTGSYTPNQANLTPASCITMCDGQGFSLAGVENGNECFCGNALNAAFPKRDTDCNVVACTGDAGQKCGGPWGLMIYQKIVAPTGPGAWSLIAGGNSGVVMTHIAVMNADTILVIDRKENNPLLNDKGHPAWGATWNPNTNTPKPVSLVTNSFCSSGSFLSNGTLANFGGHPYADTNGEAAPDGMQGVRLFTCAPSGNCDFYEDLTRIRLTSNRWYSSSIRLHDGSVLILGGQENAAWTNNPSLNNPTYEYFPPKNINGHNGTPINSQFLVDTLPHNIFPQLIALPDKKLFIAANNKAMLLDWEHNVETRLPNLPNGQRVAYPLSSVGAVLLPLTPENNYTPEVVLCGGSQISDAIPGENLSAQEDYASPQCSRMVLTPAGIAGGWQVEYMPEPRLMGDGVLMPDGKILMINGARTGIAGYGNLQYRIGDSNADNPTLTPLLYDPSAPSGSRFSRANLPTSGIGRLYHSVATLLPSGAIMIGGSNPNEDASTKPWAAEYRVEYLRPAYMTATRPTFSGTPTNVNYGSQFTLTVTLPPGTTSVSIVLMDLAFVSHSVHMDQKLVKLSSVLTINQLVVVGPPSPQVYSPGPGWLFVLADGIPSVGQQVMVGNGADPPSDPGALANLLATTVNPPRGGP